MRKTSPREDMTPLRRRRDPLGPAATLRQMQRASPWVWACCEACRHERPLALAPYVIRWGPDVSGDVLRRNLRCEQCGARGARTIHPSWTDANIGFQPFPE